LADCGLAEYNQSGQQQNQSAHCGSFDLTAACGRWIVLSHSKSAGKVTMDDLDDLKEHLEDMIRELKQERDKLRVKAGLAKLELREDWNVLEKKLVRLEARAKELGSATADASKDVGAAAKLLGEEIRKGLKSVAKHF
jgi:hypothetical protein